MAIKPRQDSHEHPAPLATSRPPLKRPRRTPRACDRCRLKRIKCDGMVRCQPCTKSDSPCLYTHQRNSTSKNEYEASDLPRRPLSDRWILKSSHWQMRDVLNEALRRMYVACKNRSGFPGTMPVGSESNHEDVSVQAILEGLGLISSPGEESPESASFNTTHNVYPVPEAPEPTSPSQSTDDTLPRLVPESASTCLQPQCRILREELVPPTITVPVARREEYHGATALLSTHPVHNPVTYFGHPVKSYQLVPNGPQHCQSPLYQGVYDNATHLLLEGPAMPSSSAYDLSYVY